MDSISPSEYLDRGVPGKHVMAAMDSTGDIKIAWDADDRDEVLAARDTFDQMLAKGYKAFSVNKDGTSDKQIKKFDKELERIVLVPKVVGG